MFDKHTLDIACPQCGHSTRQTIGWVKANDAFTCGKCKAIVSLDKEDLLAGLDSAQESIDSLRDTIRRLRFGK